jgi:hypothetical protein
MNLFIIFIGIIILVIGISTLIIPNIEKLINLPGNPQMKTFIFIFIAIIIIIFGFIF